MRTLAWAHRRIYRLALATALVVGGPVWGQEDEAGEEIVVEGVRATVEVMPGATLTVLEVGEDADRVLSLGDLMSAAPGVHIRTAGGMGAVQSLRLRGATGGEVRILVDGVPIPQDAVGALDLASLPLDDVERVEIFRGTLPPGLGGEGIGGAINLVTRHPEGRTAVDLRGGAGSFGTFEGSAWTEAAPGPWTLGAFVGGQRAKNDFRFYDDNGTPYTTADDDPDAVRQNTDFQRADLALRARRPWDMVALSLRADGMAREGGVPGPGAWQSSKVRFQDATVRGQARMETLGEPVVAGGGGLSADLGGHRYQDPEGQVGLGEQDLRSHTSSTAADGGLAWRISSALAIQGDIRAALETWSGQEGEEGTPAQRSRHRLSGSLATEASRRRVQGSLRWSGEAAWTEADGTLPYVLSDASPDESTTLLSGPAFGAAWKAREALGLRALVGRSFRLPTFPELFGDEGGIQGNASLRPERAISAEGGLDTAGSFLRGTGTLSFTAYGRDVTDLIAYVQNSQYTLKAENFEEMWVWGTEVEGAWQGSSKDWHPEAGLAWTWTRTLNRTTDPIAAGKALPGQPAHSVYLDAEAGGGVRGGGTLEVDTGNYRDTANLFLLPPRAFLHARACWEPGPRWPRVTLEVRNVLDHRVERMADVPLVGSGDPAPQAVSDWWGFPLPGRSVFLSASWSPGKDRETIGR